MSVSQTTADQLRTRQYRDASKLDARIALHRRFSVNPQGWPDWLFEQLVALGFPADARILELGAGAGTLWCDCSEQVPSGWRVRLSDFSEGMLADARGRLGARAERFDFEVIDAQSIPHPDASFDCVIANHMLYHVEDRALALSEIRRVLKPGGTLFASTLARASMGELERLVRTAAPRLDFRFGRMAYRFLLDDGNTQLSPFFEAIEVHRYEDALEITEVEPLLAYLRSMILDEPLTETELEQIGADAAQEIAKSGTLHVSKESGVFIARRPAKHSHQD